MKLTSLFLALLILFQGSFWNMDDLTRLGAFIEHAKYHADAHGDNFLEFLSKHYGELQEEHHEKHREEQSEHESLPFQNYSFAMLVADLGSLTANYNLVNNVVANNTQKNFHYLENYVSWSCFEIFDPPRLT